MRNNGVDSDDQEREIHSGKNFEMIYLSEVSLDPLDSHFVAKDSDGKKALEKKQRASDFITQNKTSLSKAGRGVQTPRDRIEADKKKILGCGLAQHSE